jgi:hypothetical protein
MKVTYQEIADAAGVSLSTAEQDKRAGLFDKKSLQSIALYIASRVKTQTKVERKVAPKSAPGSFEWES